MPNSEPSTISDEPPFLKTCHGQTIEISASTRGQVGYIARRVALTTTWMIKNGALVFAC
ncbi:MAG: hypothetical protein M1288_03885 [Actinobacteria bacterium]|nr:hypothetical protein [Actinomycetota bacterium]